MRKIFILSALLLSMAAFAQPIRVVSNQVLGHGFAPQLSADGAVVTYLEAEDIDLHTSIANPQLYVTNDNLDINLYRNGKHTVLRPRGKENYIWSSISPDGTRILYNTRYGTEICDLEGHILANVGELMYPQWYGDDYVIGHQETSDGHQYLSSCIAIAKADGSLLQPLTEPAELGMQPSAAARYGRVVYATLDGEMHLLQLNLTEEPILWALPELRLAPQMLRKLPAAQRAPKTEPSQIRIYINPGHGGYSGDDRGIAAYPFASGDTLGFWESSSNLTKGLRLDTMLRNLGMQTMLSRTLNREIDDRALSAIVAEANAYNADFMLSIHTNAGAPSNYILQLYAGRNANDTYTYPDMNQRSDEGRAITTLMGDRLYENQVSSFSHVPQIWGDKTFARQIMGWSNGYGVLRNLRVPGTISEGEMHDYRPTLYRLLNMDYRYRESFYFAETFMEYFLNQTLPYGAVGGMLRDAYRKHEFPAISYHRGTADERRAILGGQVTLKDMSGNVLQTYTTDTLYNGVFFFWYIQPGQYIVEANAADYYSAVDTVTVENGHIAYSNFFLTLQRNTPPTVIDYTPNVALTDSQIVSTEITVRFSWDMNTDSTEAAFSIAPHVDGTISWEDDSRLMRFAPASRFEPGTEYTVTISTGACHPDTNYPNHMTAPFSFSFRTMNRGSIRFLQSYPAAGAADVPLQPSFITIYDQAIVGSTVKANVAVVDAAGTEQAINTRSFSANKAPEPYGYSSFELTNPLLPNTEYKLILKPNIKDQEGIYLNQTIEIPFRTEAAQSITVPVVNPLDTLFFRGDTAASLYVSKASTLRNTSKKISGQASNQFSYTFTDLAGEARFQVLDPNFIKSNCVSHLAMQVFSDYSFNVLYAVYATDGDYQYVKICDLDYAGWKYQNVDLSVLPAGVDYQFMGFRLDRRDNFLSASGQFYIDDLSAQYEVYSQVEEVPTESAAQKRLEDGKVVIHNADATYTLTGQQIK
ncbi:MAG: Ig-like domain-containing protein [Paludibacteraceae bacterium]